MGLGNFLGAYLRLMSVQTQLRTSDRLVRLKAKLSDVFTAFQASNQPRWDEWLSDHVVDGLPSLGRVRNVLLSCDLLSYSKAVDSVLKGGPSSSSATTSSS